MKFLKVGFYLFLILVFAAFVGLHTFVSVKGRGLLVSKLHSVFLSDVSVGRVTTSFPLNLIVKDVEVKDWFKIKKVFSGAGIIDILGGNFVLSDLRLEGLEFTLEKRKKDTLASAAVNLETVAENMAQVQESFFLPAHTILKQLVISKGTFTYIDHDKGDVPIKIRVKDLNLKISNFQWPVDSSVVTSLQMSGKMPWDNLKEEGQIDLKGWINFYKKDMSLKLKIKDIDAVHIYPYYSGWIDIDKAGIDLAKLDFTSDIIGLNNDVTADCHLEMTQLAFKPKEEQPQGQRIERIANAVIGMFKALNQGKIVLDFNFKTRMDSPEFGLGIIQSAFKDKLALARKNRESQTMQIIKFPGKILEGTISSAVDLTKSVINGTVTVGKELKKAVEVSFTRDSNATGAEPAAAADQSE